MIKITIPTADITVTKDTDQEHCNAYGFDIHLIPRDQGGIFMFYGTNDELLFVGKARKLRQRVKKHFEDTVSVIKDHRDDVTKIDVCLVEDPTDREIYETYIINELQAVCNVDKVFFK